MTQYIKAPFNFVPISDKVFFPSWADQISHDIPFSDGESGEIELTITAHSPIFVRNGHTKAQAEAKSVEYKSFSKTGEKDYFIPATSIKGAIRNVMEIMSFGKMRIDSKMKFATREWDDPKIYDLKGNQKQIHCGWLSKTDNNGYQIIDCGKPDRINHKRIDEFFKSKSLSIQFKDFFAQTSDFELDKEKSVLDGKKYDPKTAAFKYALIKNDITILSGLCFEEDDIYKAKYQDNRVKVSSTTTDKQGTIVFTGSPNPWNEKRKKDSGKFYEFVFPDKDKNASILYISDQTFNFFKFIYADSDDWNFWKDKIENGGKMPVFFRCDNSGNNLRDFGLAYLYKLPFEKSPYELLPETHKPSEDADNPFKPDLTECIFGYTTNKYSLKGRVQFGHGFVNGEPLNDSEVELVLGSPKASYYPIYVKQNGQSGRVIDYNVYSKGKKIAGWKRYPIQKCTWGTKSDDNPDLNSVFVPLATGTTFKSRIRFHNLRKEEIGALLSAISFHNNQGKFFHQLGIAKPYGYGKVSFSATIDPSLKLAVKDYMSAFEASIVNDKNVFDGKLKWHDSDQITQFFTMAHDYQSDQENLLEYMHMDNDRDKNEFLNAKKFKQYLEEYTVLSKKMHFPESIYKHFKEQNEIEKKLKKIAEVKARQEAIELEKEKELEELQKRKKVKQEDALLSGFIPSNTNFSKRDAWDIFKKEIEKYICAVHADNNYGRIVAKNINGALPEKDHETVIQIINEIRKASDSKTKMKWQIAKINNPYYKKISEWLGHTKASIYLNLK